MNTTAQTQFIELQINNGPAVLPRLLLTFSRRRLHISEMVMIDDETSDAATVRLGFELATDRVDSFLRQLRRMVEIDSVDWLGQPSVMQPVAA
jgi:acetolactate synthase regulatory subunit